MKSLFYTAALLFLGIVSIQQAEAQCGGFLGSCTQINIDPNGVLTATCYDSTGGQVISSVNLDNYLSNNEGNLFYPGAQFSTSCDDFSWLAVGTSQLFLIGQCKRNGIPTYATYDLNGHIANDNGVLSWHQC